MTPEFGPRTVALAFLLAALLGAQAAGADSIFSSNGVGVEVEQAGIRSRALGGAEIAALAPDGFPGRNPASVLAADRPGMAITYIGQRRTLETAAGEQTTVVDGRLDYMRLVVPVSEKTSLAFGLTPLTRVSYGKAYTQTDTLMGVPTELNARWRLGGGLSEGTVDIAHRVGRRLILGLRFGSVFGPLRERWEPSTSDSVAFTTTESELLREHLGLRLKFGAIAQLPRGLALGAIYVPQVGIRQRHRITKFIGEHVLSTGTFEMPAEWGVGIALVVGFWEVRADISQTRWAAAKNPESQVRFRDAMALAAGVQHRLGRTGLVLAAGVRQRELYMLRPDETDLQTERFVTWGLSYRSPEREWMGRFAIDIAAEYGVRGDSDDLEERALRPAVSFALWP